MIFTPFFNTPNRANTPEKDTPQIFFYFFRGVSSSALLDRLNLLKFNEKIDIFGGAD